MGHSGVLTSGVTQALKDSGVVKTLKFSTSAVSTVYSKVSKANCFNTIRPLLVTGDQLQAFRLTCLRPLTLCFQLVPRIQGLPNFIILNTDHINQ